MNPFYQFPNRLRLSEVKDVIASHPEILFHKKEGYSVANYAYVEKETFPPVTNRSEAILRECRGLIFGKDGSVIARRYHKFFNVGEREETDMGSIDWTQPHILLEKLDGSLVSPCFIENRVRWLSKAGITPISEQVETWIDQNKKHNYHICALQRGITPIFEWCSLDNQIVISHIEPKLVLTAVRNIETGEYWSYSQMLEFGKRFEVPVVKKLDYNISQQELVDFIHAQKDMEGIVIRFDNGHMFKIKTEWYLKIHKYISYIESFKNFTSLVLSENYDDIISSAPVEIAVKMKIMHGDLSYILSKAEREIDSLYTKIRILFQSKKDFALKCQPHMHPVLSSIIFTLWNSKEATLPILLRKVLKNSLTKQEKFDSVVNVYKNVIRYSTSKGK